MFSDEEVCAALARRCGAPVFGMVCEGASNTYGFSWFDPDLKRAYLRQEGEVVDDRGTPMPEEAGIDLDDLFEDDVLEIMGRLGLPYEALETATRFDVWELDESHLRSPEAAAPPQPPPQVRKPWWKIW